MTDQKLKYYLNNKNFAKSRGRGKTEALKGKLSVVDGRIVLNSHTPLSEEPESITSHTYMRKKPANCGRRWSKEEDELFYEALACYGCEFSMMSTLFPGRPRHTLKLKYKREYKQHPDLVEQALANYGQFDEERFKDVKGRAGHINESTKRQPD